MSTQGDDHKSRDRDRSFRSERSGRGNSRQRERNDKKISDRRVYVSNIPFEYRWQDVKDLFRDEVGKVARVELFTDEDGKPRGCGIVEFEQSGLVEEAVKKMHRYDIKGRKLVVKEDYDIERDQCGRLLTGGAPEKDREDRVRNPSRSNMSRQNGGGGGGGGGGGVESLGRNSEPNFGNTYGLSTQFLESLGINGPLVTKVFVANLDYKVDEKKLLEVFKLAGKVLSVELNKDKDGKSRGFGIVEFDHPVESVQAISMLNNQQLYDRRISVRLDRSNEADGPLKLPEGLKAVGMGLGAGGNRLTDVARNLPNMQANNPPVVNPFSTPVLAASALPMAADLKNVVSAQLANALTNTNVAALQASLSGGLGANLPTNPLFNSAATNNLAGLANLETSLAVHAAKAAKLDTARGAFDGNSVFSSGGYNSGRISDDLLSRRNVDSLPTNSPGFLSGSNQVADRRQNSSDTILIRNLPSNVTWQMLRDKFQSIGDVKYAEMKGNDAALVKFSSEWDAARAASILNNSRIDGKVIQVCLY